MLKLSELGVILEESKSEQPSELNESQLTEQATITSQEQDQEQDEEDQDQDADQDQDDDQDQDQDQEHDINIIPLEVLFNEVENFPALLDIESPNENDDEAMVEYAIALSLQEQQLQNLENQQQYVVGPDGENEPEPDEPSYQPIGRSHPR